MYTTTCHTTVDYNLGLTDNMPQPTTSWSTPYTTHTLTLDEPKNNMVFFYKSKHIDSC
jgi:hypothetical protein